MILNIDTIVVQQTVITDIIVIEEFTLLNIVINSNVEATTEFGGVAGLESGVQRRGGASRRG